LSNFNKFIRFVRLKTNQIFSRFSFSQDTYLLLLGSIVGILCGFGAVLFHDAIHFIKDTFFDRPAGFFGLETFIDVHTWYSTVILILIPAIGGLLVGIMAKYFAGAKKGEGIPNVIDAVASRGGIIKGSTGFLKTLGSAISIGTGGAGGREGPIVQMGSAIGSNIGRYLSLSPDRLRILVGCGAAAGLSAAYNAPLGGALFAMEIILRTFNAKSFSPIIIASVFGTVVSRNYLGGEPAFAIPKYQLNSNYEFIFYLILGLLAAFTAVYFVRAFLKIDDVFEKLNKIPDYFKPAIGGLIVGIIGVYLPGVYGFGSSSIDMALHHQASFLIMFLLIFLKPLATGFTIGSGGNGGTFSPSIFTGAMLGGAFGVLVNYLFPEIAAPPGAYALVGMGAVVAGTTHASLTALIMVFEMTNNYKIILPLMLTIIISTTISKAILKGSLYTLKFDREGKGIDIYGRKSSVLKNIPIINLIEKSEDVVTEDIPFQKLLGAVKNSRFNNLMVTNKDNIIIGQISFQDIREAILDDETRNILYFLVAGDLMVRNIKSVTNDKNSEDALSILEKTDLEFLPVLDKSSGKYLGIVSKENILKKYQNELFIQQSEHDLALG